TTIVLTGSSLSTMGTHEGQPFVFVLSVGFVPATVPACPSGSRERLNPAMPGLAMPAGTGKRRTTTNGTNTNGWRRRESAHEHRRVDAFTTSSACGQPAW